MAKKHISTKNIIPNKVGIDWRSTLDNLYLNDDFNHKIVGLEKKPQLTLREQQVLFLILYAYNHTEISIILSKIEGKVVSPNTVSKYIGRNLYKKFQVYNSASLKSAARNFGFHKTVPEMVLSQS